MCLYHQNKDQTSGKMAKVKISVFFFIKKELRELVKTFRDLVMSEACTQTLAGLTMCQKINSDFCIYTEDRTHEPSR